MSDREAIAALVSDLHWQIDQMPVRGVKNAAGNPYNPSYYKRGLAKAISSGGDSVPDFVRGYLHKPPSEGFKKLVEADSLDLACEALVMDGSKPYAHLFTEEERQMAHKRLTPYAASIDKRKAESAGRIEARQKTLPDNLEELRELASRQPTPEESIAINTEILRQAEDDVVAMIRLGRGREALGQLEEAAGVYEQALSHDPDNRLAGQRLRDVRRLLDRRSRDGS